MTTAMRRAITIILLCGAVAGLSACEGSEADPQPVARPVLSVVAQPSDDAMRGFAGTIEPRYTTEFGFRILGRMVSRDVEVGETVQPGQRLAAIDPMALELQVRSLEAELFKMQAQAANSSADETRQQTLLERRAATQAELDTASQSAQSARAGVSRAEANLAKAREQLGYTQLVAETGGIVTAVDGEVGQVVGAGQTIVTLARSDLREAVVDIPDEGAARLSPGFAFVVTLQSDPGVTATGRVREIAPQSDAATRSRRIKITLADAPAGFRLGATVTATPILPKGAPTIDLPRAALLERDGGTFVWRINPTAQTVSTVPVVLSDKDDARIRVSSGIEPGTQIVVAGVNSLTEGQKIKLAQEIVP